jgi:uncharacterized tellurite resistance protein B-like protein
MLKAIKRIFDAAPVDTHAMPGHERRQLQLAVAVLLHEARRADYAEGDEESVRAQRALAEIFGLEPRESAALLEEGRARAVEHLWRITFADGRLDLYEDHYVRKIAHLLYVPNTQSMLARNRAADVAQRSRR